MQLRAPEFLPFNMEAGVFLVPSAAVTVPAPAAAYGYGVSPTQILVAIPTRTSLSTSELALTWCDADEI